MKKILLLIMMTVFVFGFGCAPKDFKPYQPSKLEFEKSKPHQLDLSQIPKPEKIQPIYVNDHFEEVSKENATMVVLTPDEYKKVGALVKLAVNYKQIAKEEAKLVNTKIDIINSLKELAALERKKVRAYRELWVNSENMYRQEKWEHDKDNLINRIGWYAVTIGSVTLFVLAL